VPADNGNGQIQRLFKLGGAGTVSITFTAVVNASSPVGSGVANPAVYDNSHTAARGGDVSKIDLAFYYSDCGDGVTEQP
jgi:hypothetical protein